LLLFNKADLDPTTVGRVALAPPGSVAISARTGLGVDAMLAELSDALRQHTDAVELVVPTRVGEQVEDCPGRGGNHHREGDDLVRIVRHGHIIADGGPK
jgi:GTP-binding protein HflX